MMQEEAGYRLFEHTADAGLVAWGPNPETAFSEAARGMFLLMLGQDLSEIDADGEPEQLSIQVGGEAWDDLLVSWLAEVLFYFDTEGLVPLRIDFQEKDANFTDIDWDEWFEIFEESNLALLIGEGDSRFNKLVAREGSPRNK